MSDICWMCLFPINIGGIRITANQRDNNDPGPQTICYCPAPPPLFVRVGVGISFWEPARISEVVRQPMCAPTLGGSTLGTDRSPRGSHGSGGEGEDDNAFYHVHYVQYPILNWLGMAITQGACYINESYDVAYLSELDPYWDNDELAFTLNPEAALFASLPAQAACVADSVSAAVTHYGIDALFWCSGSQGSVFPLSGSHAGHVGGVDTALAKTHTMIYKLHRQLMAMDTSTSAATCGNAVQPVMRKNQYKSHLLYPIPWTRECYGFGTQSVIWGAGKEFPVRGEDFAYFVWRKRQCCAF